MYSGMPSQPGPHCHSDQKDHQQYQAAADGARLSLSIGRRGTDTALTGEPRLLTLVVVSIIVRFRRIDW